MSFPLLSSFKAKAVLAVVVVCVAAYGGWQARDWQCEAALSNLHAEQSAALAEAHQQARWMEKRWQDAADQAGQYHAELKMAQQRAKESIQVEQNAYVTSSDRFPLPADWVFQHNYASCRVSGASESTCRADALSGIARDDKALGVITRNYLRCAERADMVEAWRAFYGRLKANSDSK